MAVLNRHKDKIPVDAVYIGRGSKWGNPFVIGHDGDRDEVVDKYHRHLLEQLRSGEVSTEEIAALDGRDLVCFCAPQACHGDVLSRYAQKASRRLKRTI